MVDNDRLYARKKDKNHNEVRDALRSAGYWCAETHRASFGFPDLVTRSKTGILVLIEVKPEDEPLTQAERKFLDDFMVNQDTQPQVYYIARSGQQAVQIMNLIDQWRMSYVN